jgi:prefoldin subunit 5
MCPEELNLRALQVQELQAQLDEWQAELDLLEARPETRIEFRERIEALRRKLQAGSDILSGGRLELPEVL